jgi:hypothetical protein
MAREARLEGRFRAWLERLPAARREALGKTYSEAAFRGGLSVLHEDGSAVAIPPSMTPAVETPKRLLRRAALSRDLLSGLVRIARGLMEAAQAGGPARARVDRLTVGLSAWERELLEQTWREGERVAIARTDFFVDGGGADRPLEMNATIPAMQAYADIAAWAFLTTFGQAAGLSLLECQALAEENGSNTEDLLLSLLAHRERLGGRSPHPRVALIARSQDAQSSELASLCAHFNARGLETYRCTPDQIRLDAGGRALLLDRPVDILYRHIFARRIAPESDLARIARDPARHCLLNPVNSQLEMKSLLAELSAAGADAAQADAIGLSPDERSAAAAIPWTRCLAAEPTTGPGGERLADLLAFAADHPAELVLKRSWGYGGTSVLLGDAIETEEGQARARSMLATDALAPIPWADLVARCAQQGGFVVQRKIELRPERHLVVGPSGPAWTDWYVDISAFTSHGAEPIPGGGVCRGSRSRIVNIVLGGGLVPLISSAVMEPLLAALKA